jgi:hypothetical protein
MQTPLRAVLKDSKIATPSTGLLADWPGSFKCCWTLVVRTFRWLFLSHQKTNFEIDFSRK